MGAMARAVLQVRKQQQHRVLDGLLFLFACMCLIAATVLLMREATSIYTVANWVTSVVDGSDLENQVGSAPSDFEYAVRVVTSEGYTYSVLIWVAIFAIKFCYLLFFRQLIDRLNGIVIYWKITMSITALSFGFNFCALFIACSQFGQKACELPLVHPHHSSTLHGKYLTVRPIDVSFLSQPNVSHLLMPQGSSQWRSYPCVWTSLQI